MEQLQQLYMEYGASLIQLEILQARIERVKNEIYKIYTERQAAQQAAADAAVKKEEESVPQ